MLQLIPNWRKSWRMISVQCMTLAAALQGAWVALPVEMQSFIPSWLVQLITMILLVAGVLGRLIDQPKTRHRKACQQCGRDESGATHADS